MGRVQYFSTVLGELGAMLVFMSPVTFVPLLLIPFTDEWDVFLPMILVPVFLFLVGEILNKLPRRKSGIRLSAALCSVALVWLVFAVISVIPFMMVLEMSFVDALFDCMAGWTGTSFTMLGDLSTVPETLLFWRTFMQWVGGFGIIAYTITMANRSGLNQSPYFRSDSRDERILPAMIATGRQIWAVYILITLMATGIIILSRVPLWDAINLAISGVSTGGFIPRPGGLSYYNNPALEYLLVPIMIIGSVPFTLFYASYRKRRLSFPGNEQLKLLIIFIVFGSLLVISDLYFIGGYALFESVRQGLFMTTAAVSTTGFQNANPHLFPGVTVVFLTMLMFIGGSSGSTAGGLKLSRIALGYRGIIWWFRRTFVRGKVLVPFKYEGRTIAASVGEQELSKNMLVIILSVLTIFAATLVILQVHITSFGVPDLLFDIVSALSSCGVSTGYVSPTMPLISKWVFILVMWIGRLEVIPVIILFMGLFRGRD